MVESNHLPHLQALKYMGHGEEIKTNNLHWGALRKLDPQEADRFQLKQIEAMVQEVVSVVEFACSD